MFLLLVSVSTFGAVLDMITDRLFSHIFSLWRTYIRACVCIHSCTLLCIQVKDDLITMCWFLYSFLFPFAHLDYFPSITESAQLVYLLFFPNYTSKIFQPLKQFINCRNFKHVCLTFGLNLCEGLVWSSCHCLLWILPATGCKCTGNACQCLVFPLLPIIYESVFTGFWSLLSSFVEPSYFKCSTFLLGKNSHKDVKDSTNWLFKAYYGNRMFMAYCCVSCEVTVTLPPWSLLKSSSFY